MPDGSTFITSEKIVYAKRAFDIYGRNTTYTAWDAADREPQGWVNGWFEDGHVRDGYTMVHVTGWKRGGRDADASELADHLALEAVS